MELLAAFQSCERDNKTARSLFAELEKELEIRWSEKEKGK
jgi:hypothetical protein